MKLGAGQIASWNYISDEILHKWLAEECSLKSGTRCRSADLFASWTAWAEKNEVYRYTIKTVSRNLLARGYKPCRNWKGQQCFHGIAVKEIVCS
jgi:hypothetical protein